jgi:flagellar biosynthetic protein FliO
MWDVVVRLISAGLVLVLVLLLAWLVLRWLSRRMPGAGVPTKKRAIKVLDRLSMGRSGTVMLLRVKDKVLLVAMTDHGAEKLYEFDDPDGEFDLEKPGEAPAFADALKDAARRLRGKKKDGGDDAP